LARLYHLGWRQGSLFLARLACYGVILNEAGTVVQDYHEHDAWVVATQNCDLARFEETGSEDVVELRPVFRAHPPSERGIRSRKYLLGPPGYLEAESRRLMISPAALQALLRLRTTRDNVVADDEDRVRGLKTWLGYRYDRPAVPDEYHSLATRIAEEVERHRARSYSGQVRDILVQFVEDDPPRYKLFAVIIDAADRDEIRLWLAEVARAVPAELGIADEFDAATADQTSLALIEASYAVDLTSVTWGGKTIRGATGRLSGP